MPFETAAKAGSGSARATRVLFADDYELAVCGFLSLFGHQQLTNVEICGLARSSRELLNLVSTASPDVVICGIHKPDLNGAEAVLQLLRQFPALRIILLTGSYSPALAAQLLRGGVSGFLLKSSVMTELAAAIRAVKRNKTYISKQMRRDVKSALNQEVPAKLRNSLSPRQSQVLGLLAEGHSMKVIASRLGITPRTVAFHKYEMMQALGISNSAQLVKYALRNGITSRASAPTN